MHVQRDLILMKQTQQVQAWKPIKRKRSHVKHQTENSNTRSTKPRDHDVQSSHRRGADIFRILHNTTTNNEHEQTTNHVHTRTKNKTQNCQKRPWPRRPVHVQAVWFGVSIPVCACPGCSMLLLLLLLLMVKQQTAALQWSRHASCAHRNATPRSCLC